MEEVIDRLMRAHGSEVARAFKRARAFWKQFLAAHRQVSPAALAQAITQAQWDYEPTFGIGRSIAKSTMPITCIACLYDIQVGWRRGREAYARRILAAFEASSVSLEVKAAAREAAAVYRLD